MKEVLVDETIDTLVRIMKDGTIRPTSFLWRNRTRYVDNIGREWEERVAGKIVRISLLQTVDGNTFELCHDPAANRWSIRRAWLQDIAV